MPISSPELAAVVAVVVPAAVVEVPGVVAAREADQPVPVLAPHAEPEDDLVVAEVRVIVHGQHGLRLDSVKWQESVVEAVGLSSDHVYGDPDIWPLEVAGGRPGTVPDHDHLVEVGEAVEPGQGADQHLVPLEGEHDHGELLARRVPAQRLAELQARAALAAADGPEAEAGAVELGLGGEQRPPGVVRRQLARAEHGVPGEGRLGQQRGVVPLEAGRGTGRLQGSCQ